MKEKDKKSTVDRRTFLKYSLGVGGGLMFGSGITGLVRPLGAATPGGRIQKIVYSVTPLADQVELARQVALSCKEIGIEVEIETLEFGAFMAKAMKKHEAIMSCMRWSGAPERIDPSFFLTQFFHSKHSKKGGRNYEHYMNPEYDKLCDAQNREMDKDKRIKLVHKCQEILARDYPMWILGFPDTLNAYNSEAFEGPAGMMGAGIGSESSIWTWLQIKPKTNRKKIVMCNRTPIKALSLKTRSGTSRALLRMIYDTFLRLGPDLKLVPWAAESWKVINDTTIDIVLRKGMKFHDGKPVTIEDVKFTFDYLKDKKMAMYRSVYDAIEKTEVLDANTFRFFLKEPSASFISNELVYAHILPKHIWEKIDEPDKLSMKKPIGSGPFKFGHWKRGEEMYFEANKEHFYPPKIDGYYRKVIPSMEGIIAALENKEIDIESERLSSEMADELSKLSHIKIVGTPTHGPFEIRGALDQKPFSDLAFRKAISHIIPRDEYGELVFGKAWNSATNTVIHPKLKPWHNDRIPFDEYSVPKAKEILKKAGYTWDKKGFLRYPG